MFAKKGLPNLILLIGLLGRICKFGHRSLIPVSSPSLVSMVGNRLVLVLVICNSSLSSLRTLLFGLSVSRHTPSAPYVQSSSSMPYSYTLIRHLTLLIHFPVLKFCLLSLHHHQSPSSSPP